MAYNMDGSDFYKLAAKFQQRFEEQFAKVRFVRIDSSRDSSVDEKKVDNKMSYKLSKGCCIQIKSQVLQSCFHLYSLYLVFTYIHSISPCLSM